ncbi:hypothetical protein [Azospirillum sp. SYSU D00513]|uniref:hypothetical protein n=1 Tax=Azospirillum sp. SYSU D00513 TaxID=2812561 RepID=UPI001A972E1E|nr:hypothetical protein [Azospirillum sp. SYSU D00513]
MARYVKSDRFDERVKRALPPDERVRADRTLKRLGENPPPAEIELRPMEGQDGLLWEMRAGGANRFILRRCRDREGDYFLVEDVGSYERVEE